jgi:hypothetical protein
MKLKELQEIFPVIQKVYDSIDQSAKEEKDDKDQQSAFQRGIDLIPAYRKLKEKYDLIESKRQELSEQMRKEKQEIDEQFKNPDTGKVEYRIKNSPAYQQKINELNEKLNREFNNYLETDTGKLSPPLKFKKKEVQKAKENNRIKWTELALIYEDFVKE